MFKSTFAKYLITFVIIISISFLVLSGIITTMIRSYFTEEKREKVISTADGVAELIESRDLENVEAAAFVDMIEEMLSLMFRNDPDVDVSILNASGEVVLTTVGVTDAEVVFRRPEDDGERVDISRFSVAEYAEGEEALLHKGTLGGFFSETSIACINDIFVDGEVRGYIMTSYSTVKEDAFIVMTNRVVLTSTVWVLIAAVIAVYFITQRIISPLRNMKVAVKKFGKGDFSTRVAVYGSDEISELATAFNNMADSLEKLEKMRSSFLASVSHDLRTPMTTIAGFIDGIMSGAIPPEKQGYYLQIISSEVHRLSRLVSQLLDVSRLESGDRKMSFEDFDVAEMARIILISFEQKIEDKRLEVEFDAEEDEMSVFADKDAIHQVLYNLCHNGIKFAKEGGRFSIRLCSLDQKRVRISVYDEGQIIADEEKGMIFERFYKTDSSRGLDKNGVGLGLYISKTIIEAHDEKIGVETDGCGSEFFFTLKKSK
ncbi:MAG: HAMP domain-containing histidine kinase [Clostridia bacterium]|nr:HAMP domain-containing histidine kinase [Clostridia bacterium]